MAPRAALVADEALREARNGAASSPVADEVVPRTSATKTCPRCGALVFADMDVCYGCLYDFTRPPHRMPGFPELDEIDEAEIDEYLRLMAAGAHEEADVPTAVLSAAERREIDEDGASADGGDGDDSDEDEVVLEVHTPGVSFSLTLPPEARVSVRRGRPRSSPADKAAGAEGPAGRDA